jgi:hypothetical protein
MKWRCSADGKDFSPANKVPPFDVHWKHSLTVKIAIDCNRLLRHCNRRTRAREQTLKVSIAEKPPPSLSCRRRCHCRCRCCCCCVVDHAQTSTPHSRRRRSGLERAHKQHTTHIQVRATPLSRRRRSSPSPHLSQNHRSRAIEERFAPRFAAALGRTTGAKTRLQQDWRAFLVRTYPASRRS